LFLNLSYRFFDVVIELKMEITLRAKEENALHKLKKAKTAESK